MYTNINRLSGLMAGLLTAALMTFASTAAASVYGGPYNFGSPASAADIAMLERHINDEHAALDANDPGRALYLSGLFHTEIARIAQQATIAGFIETLIARSSLIIALYWRRESALCEKHAHHALVEALADHNEQQAEELMRSHLVDLHSALDLRERNGPTLSLKDVLSS